VDAIFVNHSVCSVESAFKGLMRSALGNPRFSAEGQKKGEKKTSQAPNNTL
jgi:hypothetical protein